MENARQVYSQHGEDGIIEKILERIPKTDKWCVEFGAYDGKWLSNCRNLIEHQDYAAVLIEPDKRRFKDLERNYAENNRVTTLNQVVGFSGDDCLDSILAQTGIPQDFDLVSIDIDGHDYHVWKSMRTYRPKCVVIEFNHSMPNAVHHVQKEHTHIAEGSSLRALIELGKAKGYELVSVLVCNAFFVRKEDYSLFEIGSNDIDTLHKDTSCITHLYTTYDGTLHISGNGWFMWHGIDISERRLQQIPRLLRQEPERYNCAQKVLFRMYSWHLHFLGWLKKILGRTRRP